MDQIPPTSRISENSNELRLRESPEVKITSANPPNLPQLLAKDTDSDDKRNIFIEILESVCRKAFQITLTSDINIKSSISEISGSNSGITGFTSALEDNLPTTIIFPQITSDITLEDLANKTDLGSITKDELHDILDRLNERRPKERPIYRKAPAEFQQDTDDPRKTAILSILKKLLKKEVMYDDQASINLNSNLKDDLGLDSVDMVNFAMIFDDKIGRTVLDPQSNTEASRFLDSVENIIYYLMEFQNITDDDLKKLAS